MNKTKASVNWKTGHSEIIVVTETKADAKKRRNKTTATESQLRATPLLLPLM